jgi:hypothetical protein
MKIKRTLLQNVLCLWSCKSRNEDKNTHPLVNMHKTLTMVSLSGGYTSTLCSTILGTPITRMCWILCNLATCSSHKMFSGLRSGFQQSYLYGLRIQCVSIQPTIFQSYVVTDSQLASLSCAGPNDNIRLVDASRDFLYILGRTTQKTLLARVPLLLRKRV